MDEHLINPNKPIFNEGDYISIETLNGRASIFNGKTYKARDLGRVLWCLQREGTYIITILYVELASTGFRTHIFASEATVIPEELFLLLK